MAEGPVGHAQQLSGLGADAACRAKSLGQISLFEFGHMSFEVEGLLTGSGVAFGRQSLLLGYRVGEMIETDKPIMVGTDGHGPLNGVFQFPNIAGPRVAP